VNDALPKGTVLVLRVVIVGLVLVSLFIAVGASQEPPPSTGRLTVGVNTLRLPAGDHSMWWQTQCRPEVFPELELFAIDLRTAAGEQVEVRPHTPTGIGGDRSGLCRYAVGRFSLDSSGDVTVSLDADPSVTFGVMIVSAGDAERMELLPLLVVPAALLLALAAVAATAWRARVPLATALRQITAR
jgi:hypothetical protein